VQAIIILVWQIQLDMIETRFHARARVVIVWHGAEACNKFLQEIVDLKSKIVEALTEFRIQQMEVRGVMSLVTADHGAKSDILEDATLFTGTL